MPSRKQTPFNSTITCGSGSNSHFPETFQFSLNELITRKDKDNLESLLHLEKPKTELKTSCEQGMQLNIVMR